MARHHALNEAWWMHKEALASVQENINAVFLEKMGGLKQGSPNNQPLWTSLHAMAVQEGLSSDIAGISLNINGPRIPFRPLTPPPPPPIGLDDADSDSDSC